MQPAPFYTEAAQGPAGPEAVWHDTPDGARLRLAHWPAAPLPGQPALGPSHGPAHRHLCLRALALMPHADAAR